MSPTAAPSKCGRDCANNSNNPTADLLRKPSLPPYLCSRGFPLLGHPFSLPPLLPTPSFPPQSLSLPPLLTPPTHSFLIFPPPTMDDKEVEIGFPGGAIAYPPVTYVRDDPYFFKLKLFLIVIKGLFQLMAVVVLIYKIVGAKVSVGLLVLFIPYSYARVSMECHVKIEKAKRGENDAKRERAYRLALIRLSQLLLEGRTVEEKGNIVGDEGNIGDDGCTIREKGNVVGDEGRTVGEEGNVVGDEGNVVSDKCV